MIYETQSRTMIKAVSYRVFGSTTTAMFVLVFTSKLEIALTVGALEALSKLVLFYLHDRAWHKISFGKHEVQPSVIWISGLSGSKKKELAEAVSSALKTKKLKVEILNGENIRTLIPNIGFSRDQRIDHIKRVGLFASLIEKNGIFTICSFVSPDREARAFVRSLCKNFIEVHVCTPLEECRKNDERQIYKMAEEGLLENVAGIHFPYEESTEINFSVDLSTTPISKAAERILRLCRV